MKVIYGRAGSGKSEFIFNNIKNNKDFELEISTDKLYCFLNNIDINSYLNKPIIKSND